MDTQQFNTILATLDNMATVCREHQRSTQPGVTEPDDYLCSMWGIIVNTKLQVLAAGRAATVSTVRELLWSNLRGPLASTPKLGFDHENWAVERLQQLLDNVASTVLA